MGKITIQASVTKATLGDARTLGELARIFREEQESIEAENFGKAKKVYYTEEELWYSKTKLKTQNGKYLIPGWKYDELFDSKGNPKNPELYFKLLQEAQKSPVETWTEEQKNKFIESRVKNRIKRERFEIFQSGNIPKNIFTQEDFSKFLRHIVSKGKESYFADDSIPYSKVRYTPDTLALKNANKKENKNLPELILEEEKRFYNAIKKQMQREQRYSIYFEGIIDQLLSILPSDIANSYDVENIYDTGDISVFIENLDILKKQLPIKKSDLNLLAKGIKKKDVKILYDFYNKNIKNKVTHSFVEDKFKTIRLLSMGRLMKLEEQIVNEKLNKTLQEHSKDMKKELKNRNETIRQNLKKEAKRQKEIVFKQIKSRLGLGKGLKDFSFSDNLPNTSLKKLEASNKLNKFSIKPGSYTQLFEIKDIFVKYRPEERIYNEHLGREIVIPAHMEDPALDKPKIYVENKMHEALIPISYLKNEILKHAYGSIAAATYFQILVSNTPIDEEYDYIEKRVKVTGRIDLYKTEKDDLGEYKVEKTPAEMQKSYKNKKQIKIYNIKHHHKPDSNAVRYDWILHYKGKGFKASDFPKEYFDKKADKESINNIALLIYLATKDSEETDNNFYCENTNRRWILLEYGGYFKDSGPYPSSKYGGNYLHGVKNHRTHQAPYGMKRATDALWNVLTSNGEQIGYVSNFINSKFNQLDVSKISSKIMQKIIKQDSSIKKAGFVEDDVYRQIEAG